MKKTSLCVVFILLSLAMLANAMQAGQTQSPNTDVLDRQVTKSDIKHSTTRYSFFASMSSTRVPGGIVTIQNCNDTQEWQPTYIPPGTLRDALGMIVSANPQYRWDVDNGVVNLLTTEGEPELLNVRVKKLKVENAPTINVILNSLVKLPEVKAAIAKLRLIPNDMKIIFGSSSPSRERYKVNCENVTVREALNAIVRTHGRAVWEYKEQRCNGETEYSLDFIIK